MVIPAGRRGEQREKTAKKRGRSSLFSAASADSFKPFWNSKKKKRLVLTVSIVLVLWKRWKRRKAGYFLRYVPVIIPEHGPVYCWDEFRMEQQPHESLLGWSGWGVGGGGVAAFHWTGSVRPRSPREQNEINNTNIQAQYALIPRLLPLPGLPLKDNTFLFLCAIGGPFSLSLHMT